MKQKQLDLKVKLLKKKPSGTGRSVEAGLNLHRRTSVWGGTTVSARSPEEDRRDRLAAGGAVTHSRGHC